MNISLLVFEGADASGKALQTKMLAEQLRSEGEKVETLSFPQYNSTIGSLIRECLDGKRGDFLSLDPRIASLLYAADRFESKEKITHWLSAGNIVVLDRFVGSNMIHQGAKIKDEKDLKQFLLWLDHLEHGVFGIPRPDMVVYLDIPAEKRATLMSTRLANTDIAESDITHQQAVDRCVSILSSFPENTWVPVRCIKNGILRTPEDIHREVVRLVRSR